MGLFQHHSSTSAVCNPLPGADYNAEPIAGSWTFHKIITVTGAALTILTILICLFLSVLHLRYYTNPPQQRQLVRIIIVPAMFALFSFFALWFYDASFYLIPVPDFYECFALVAIFYYIISVVIPHEDDNQRDEFFSQLENKGKDGIVTPGGSLKWFSKQWILVFMLLPGRLLTTIITYIVIARVCPSSSHRRTALLILNVVNGIQTAVCVLAILRTYGRLRSYLVGHRLVAKLAALKIIVLVQLVQRAVFSGLAKHSILKGSAYVSYEDLEIGLPNFMTVCEVFLVALFYGIPYSWVRYKTGNEGVVRVGEISFAGALLDVVNVSDIVRGVFKIMRLQSVENGESQKPPLGSRYTERQN